MRIVGRAFLALLLAIFILTAVGARAQGDWSALLTFDPYPSPYFSDWENNPAIGQALITNSSDTTVSVKAFLTITHESRGKLASANSRLFEFPPGESTNLTTRDLIDDQSIEYDNSIRELAVRTGRLPEGKYRICLRLENESGVVLLDNQCTEFTIVYPDPPYLVYPGDGESNPLPYPVFQWTPVQVPIGYQVHYSLQVAEILEGQAPYQALAANYPQYRNDNLPGTSLQYPIDALPLKKGARYAWQVQVLDDKGYPPSANNGRSEIWTFLCDVDTTTPIEVRKLTGVVIDSATGQSLDSARVVYRPVTRHVSDNDTTWTEKGDSIVVTTDAGGAFRFDSALYQSYYSLTATKTDYQTVRLSGQALYVEKDVTDAKIRMSFAPPGNRRLAGVLRDFFSNEPVPNATIEYKVVEARSVSDTSGSSHYEYVEVPRKILTTMTDAEGRFEFLQAADSSFFSLRASKTPSYMPAKEIGAAQRQVGDIDHYILLIKPNAGNISGTLVTTIGGKTIPVPRALVRLVRTATINVRTTFFGQPFNQSTVLVDSSHTTAYSNASGKFTLKRINQEKPSGSDTLWALIGWMRVPLKTTTTSASYSYRVAVNDSRYRPYLSPDSIIVLPGETTESGEHFLTPKSGAIVGRVLSDTSGVEGATVYLYHSTYQQPRREESDNAGGAETGKLGSSSAAGRRPLPADDTTWGNAGTQRPSGEPLDMYQTDQTGVYAFQAVPINDPDQATDRYTVWVEAPAFNPAAKGTRLERENETDTVNFSLTKVGGIIFGHVTTSSGGEVSNVRVELHHVDSIESEALIWNPTPAWVLSGGDGSYSFANLLPGLYRLQFSRSGYNTLTTDTFRVDYGDRFMRDESLDAAKGFISLTVTDKDKKGLVDVCVKSDQIPSLIGFTDRDGKLLIIDAPTDSVTLKLRQVGYADLDTSLVISANDTTKITCQLQRSVGQVVVRVVEKGKTSKRLEDMIVKLGKAGKDQLNDTTDAQGEVVLKEAPTGQQTLNISPKPDTAATDYVIVETKIEVFPGVNARPIVVEMEPAARMQGVIKNRETGQPLGGVSVSIEGNSKTKAVSDSTTGVFKLRNVPAGESTTLIAFKCGFKSARHRYDKRIAAGDKIDGVEIELEKSPMDSLFGFAVALDSVKTGTNGRNRVWGALIQIPPTFGIKLADESARLNFANLEVDSAYKPTADSIALVETEISVDVFGLAGKMKLDGGLALQWIDSAKAGRISGNVTLNDPISKLFPETKFLDITIPKKQAPSFWAGGINRGLSRFGLQATDKEIQVKIKSVTFGIDFTKSHVDTAGLHFFGSIQFGTSFKVGFEEFLIGKDAGGDIAIKAITIQTKPAIKIPFGVFTVVDSSMTWEATGFKASGAIVLNALDNREFGFKDLRISPEGEFLSLTVTADSVNGVINVYGQKFEISKIEFGTENFASQTLEHTKYFAFAGKLKISKLEKPIGMNLRYTEKGLFTGKLEFNQTIKFGSVVTISFESVELGYDSTKAEKFVGFSGGVRLSAVVGLSLQASNFRFYYGGDIAFDKMALDFIAGPVQVKVSVGYKNDVFEGSGWFEVKPVFSAGAEFRYGGAQDWWVRIISGTRIPIGPVEIVQASGGIGRKGDVWKFSVGGIIAPAKADKGIKLDLLIEVQKTPAGVIILGNAGVEVGNGTQIGKATIEINMPERRINGSIVFAIDYKALTASAQLDLGIKFGEYWYVYGRANINCLKFFKADGVIVVANNWQWQHDGKSQLMSGIYIELNSLFNVDANWYVIKWGVNFHRHAMVYIGWNGDFAGRIDMSGGAYAWIGFGPFDLIQARANMALGANLSYYEPEWTVGARGNFSLQGSIGWCGNANCWTICWKCFVRIFGHCVFALPTGAKACIGMNANIEYATSKGMTWDISF